MKTEERTLHQYDSKIIKVLNIDNRGEWAVNYVLLEDGESAEVWVGGDVTVFLHNGKIKAYVKRRKAKE
jgi:hypothetical protein